ncbi:MAG: DUF86 domain-containing protein [Pseudomonas sp.]
MDRLIVERKLDSLQRCLGRIASKRPLSVAELEADIDLQDVLVLNLSRAIQICVDLAAHVLTDLPLPPPGTMGEAFDLLAQARLLDADLALRMKKAVGFRNIAVHAYDTIDWNIVFAITTGHLRDFEGFARAVVVHIDG